MRFEIDRAKWDRGTDGCARLIRVDTGKMCCLGFFLAACGIPDDDLFGVGEPNEVANASHTSLKGMYTPDQWPKEAGFLLDFEKFSDADENGDEGRWSPRGVEETLMHENDYPHPEGGEAGREKRIAELFAEHGHEVVFVGEDYPRTETAVRKEGE